MNKTYKSCMIALSAVAFFTSCSESESLQQAHLSTDQINFIASMAHQWDANTKSAPQNPSSRSAGERDNEAPIHVNANLAKPLYLHPVVQDGIHIWSKNGTPITRSGAPIEDVDQERVVQTRGSKKNYLSNYSKFGVTALYQNEGSYVSLFTDAAATNSTGTYWNIPDASKTWPIDSKVSFHAYAPYSSESNSMLSSTTDPANVQTNIHYKASSDDIVNQPDLIVATNAVQRSNTDPNEPVVLQFSHVLTAVSFAMSRDLADVIGNGAQLTSVSLIGIPNEGVYQLIAQDDKHSSSSENWKLGSSKGTYTFDLSKKNITVGSNLALTDANQTLMMIPQTLPDGAKLEFTFMLNSQEQVLTVDLMNQKWKAGTSVIYKLSANVINTLAATAVTYPSSWTESSFPKTDFTANDAIGLYVVDRNNKIVENNVMLTLGSDNKWTTSKKFLKLTGYKYFVYYPYKSEDQKVNPLASDASDFFADKISSLNPTTDQSNQSTLLAQDFQVATGQVGGDASTLTFTMKHCLGLAEITLGAKTFDNNYYLSNYKSYTWKNGTTTFHAYAGISGYSLYKVADYRYVALVKPDVTTDFSCGSTTDADSWTEKVSVKPAKNGVDRVIAKSKRTSWPARSYTMKVGDIYYDNGGITKPTTDEIEAARKNGLTTIGIIGYLEPNYWTEQGVSGTGVSGGHALVMCLKTIGSTGYKDTGKGYQWSSSTIDEDRTNVNSKSLIENSYKESYGSGYTETEALINKWGEDAAATAAYQAKNYRELSAPKDKCTGWFLPTAGQYYAVMTTLGAKFSDDWTINKFFSNMTTVTKNINDKLIIVGKSNYTDFFGVNKNHEWTSSEFSSTGAVLIDSGVYDYGGPGCVRFYGDVYPMFKSAQISVRPFLAF